jgi:membrane protein
MEEEGKAETEGAGKPPGGSAGFVRSRLWPGIKYQVKRYARIFHFAGGEFKRDHCVIRSAALSFVTLLSLVPAAFVFFIILNAVGAFKQFGENLRNTLTSQVVPQSEQFDTVRQWLSETTDKLVSQASGDITGISFNLVSFGAMLITAGLLLLAIEKAMNDIWSVNVKRGVLKRFSNIWMIITIGPVLVFFSYFFGLSLYSSMAKELAQQNWLYDAFLFVLPYFFSILAFYLLFQFVPYTAVRADAALAGAVFSGIVWEFSKLPFTAYVSNVINPSGVYGPLGVIPFFLLWVYLSWVITLFGTELCYCKQNFEIMASAHKHRAHFLSLYRGFYTLRVLGEAVESFNSGQGPFKINRLAKKLNVPLNWCRELAEQLRKKQLLNYAGPDHSRYHLVKPPDKITLGEALEGISAAQLEVPSSADTMQDRVIREVFDTINRHREETLRSVTFADVVEPPGGMQ